MNNSSIYSNKVLSIKTNLQALIYLMQRQTFYSTIIKAVNEAGSFALNNKLFFFGYNDRITKRKYTLSAYEIFYAKRRMFLYTTPEIFYDDPIVQKFIQAYAGKFEVLQQNNDVYRNFYNDYQEALYYSRVFGNIDSALWYQNNALDGVFVFNVNPKFFPNVPPSQYKKAYSLKGIHAIYASQQQFYV